MDYTQPNGGSHSLMQPPEVTSLTCKQIKRLVHPVNRKLDGANGYDYEQTNNSSQLLLNTYYGFGSISPCCVIE